jgi:MGT family glycosyltransferase
MTRYLFISRANRGHVNPMIPVAQWLRRSGHEILWLTIPRDPMIDQQLTSIGATCLHLPSSPIGYGLTEDEAARMFREDPRRAAALVIELHTTRPRKNVEAVRELIRSVRPRMVVQDGVLYEGAIGAHAAGVPFVNASPNFRQAAPPDVRYWLADIAKEIDAARRALFEDHGVPAEFREIECVSPMLNTIFSTAEFLPAEHLPPNTHLVGPSLPIGRRGDEPDLPLDEIEVDARTVYLSLGTILNWQPRLALVVAEAAHSLGLRTLMAVGGLADDRDLRAALPATARVHRYLPQLTLLAKAAVFVNHGGPSSVTDGLLHGRPLLTIPLGLDQGLQKFVVERAGVGLGLWPDEVSLESCRAALRALLPASSTYRARASQVSRSLRAGDGARRAAELIIAASA